MNSKSMLATPHDENRPRVLFRAEASDVIGGGHLMRCLTLADALRGAGLTCWFAASPETIALLSTRLRGEHSTVVLSPDQATHVDVLRRLGPFALAVFDGYSMKAEYEHRFRSIADRLVVIDDLADRAHDCDVLIDQTIGRNPTDYQALVPAQCQLLTGSAFALLRPQFRHMRRTAIASRDTRTGIRRINIAFGYSLAGRAVQLALEAASQTIPEATIDLVAGIAPREETARLPSHVKVHTAVRDVAALLAPADLAIGAAGISAYERCTLGLPALIMTTADNQQANAEGLAARRAVHFAGHASELALRHISDALAGFAADPPYLTIMSQAAADIADGLGPLRVVAEILPHETLSAGSSFKLRLMREADLDAVYSWQIEPDARRYSRNPAPPTLDQHKRWFRQRLRRRDTLDLIAELDGQGAGLVRLDPAGQKDWEISILLAGWARGRGLGRAMLRRLCRIAATETLHAEIHPENLASTKAFTAADFRPTGEPRKYRHNASLDIL